MSGEDKPDPDFAAASAWEFRHRGADDDCADHSYFFATDDFKDSSILSEFGWNIPADSSGASDRDGGFADFAPIEPDLAASRADDCVAPDVISSSIEPMADASASNPSVSSSSSDDSPEKTAAANPPPEAA